MFSAISNFTKRHNRLILTAISVKDGDILNHVTFYRRQNSAYEEHGSPAMADCPKLPNMAKQVTTAVFGALRDKVTVGFTLDIHETDLGPGGKCEEGDVPSSRVRAILGFSLPPHCSRAEGGEVEKLGSQALGGLKGELFNFLSFSFPFLFVFLID